jgi:hypothetical protein
VVDQAEEQAAVVLGQDRLEQGILLLLHQVKVIMVGLVLAVTMAQAVEEVPEQ